ncbi:MAG: DUF6069 family protein [Actinocatenispora sp.]
MAANATAEKSTRSPMRRFMTVILAMIIAAAIWIVAHPVAGVDLTVKNGDTTQQVGIASVLLVTGLVGLVAWAGLAILEKISRRGGRVVWTVIALIVLVLSLGGPVTLATTDKARWILIALHVVVGLILITSLPRRRRA